MLDSRPIEENRGSKVAKRSFTASTSEGLSSLCDRSSISDFSGGSSTSPEVEIEFLNKRRRQWLHSCNTIRCYEDKKYQDLEMDSDVMFIVMRVEDMATEPIIIGASHNYIKELEFFRDEIVGYPVSHFLAKSQPEDPIWIDCLNWNLVYRREKGREFHVAQAGAELKICGDTLILGCATPVEKCLGELDLTIHRKLKAIAKKMVADAAFVSWAKLEYSQYVKEDSILFPNRSKPRGLESRNTFINVGHERKQSLSKMLSKSSLCCLDLSVAEAKVTDEDAKSDDDVRALKEAQSYQDLPDPADGHDCKHPPTRPKNIGSISHPGCKKACQFFFFSYKGCNNGFQCEFCHEGHVSNRKAKAKAWVEKQNERAREKEAQEAAVTMAQPPMWYPSNPVYWPPQSANDAMAVGFTPVAFVPAPMAPMTCSTCTNCGCHGRVHSLQSVQSVQAPPQTVLVPSQPRWAPQPEFTAVQWQPEYAWQPEYPAPAQWPAQPEYGLVESAVPVWEVQPEPLPQWAEPELSSTQWEYQMVPTPPIVQR
jgi:hypothetical protein